MQGSAVAGLEPGVLMQVRADARVVVVAREGGLLPVPRLRVRRRRVVENRGRAAGRSRTRRAFSPRRLGRRVVWQHALGDPPALACEEVTHGLGLFLSDVRSGARPLVLVIRWIAVVGLGRCVLGGVRVLEHVHIVDRVERDHVGAVPAKQGVLTLLLTWVVGGCQNSSQVRGVLGVPSVSHVS